MSEVVHLPLRKIIRDPRCQPRVNPLDSDHVEEMREAKANGATFPPVVVYREQLRFDGPEELYLSEGFHRFEVYDLDAEETIPAIVRPGTLEDAIVNAMASNAAHGLKRTRGDLKKAIETMLDMTLLSDRAIAQHCRCSFSYVSQVHRERDEEKGVHNAHPEEPAAPVVKKGKDGVEREYVKPVREAPKQEPESFEEVAKRAEEEVNNGQASQFDMNAWKKSYRSVITLMTDAAKRSGMMNGPEHRAAMLAADSIQKFLTRTLSKPQK